MLINDEIQRQLLQLFAKSSNLPKIEAEQQSASQLQLNPGQQVQAEVVAKLPNHLFLARIAGELFKMEIPLNVQPGETMHLTVVTAEPRITFELAKGDNGNGPVNISAMGKWLSSLVGDAGVEQNAAVRLFSMSKVLDGPPADMEQFASRLREALTLNGLFYESHLAEWAIGERQLKDILREPQGKLSKRLAAGSLKAGQNQSSDDDMMLSSFKGESVSSDRPSSAHNRSSAEFIADSQTFPIIREQLAALHTGHLVWNGQVWPDQKMEITIEERDVNGSRGEPQEKAWETSLKLHLPRLGTIAATLRLSADGVDVVVEAENVETTTLLKGDGEGLRQSMDGAGMKLAHLVVKDGKTA
ncbi:flagellar hook-length control protein FliK [Geotalea uraniireducens]|uniref:Flagellar hook-length control protein-like C-terminal domain-containing protein n=1 Tax=Geotalea uraniireducens (strain Rf4) TaxID=351605 RepID=A5G431_GEOUR|nr:flagellar hook-length control protein FliK [Geotalea uraniireducens]ABQ26549.1 hypothetical protein Gura_2370 [Geotalea uraniireducens Rf4]